MKLIRYRPDVLPRSDAVASRMAIVGAPGRIYTSMVWIDSPISLQKVPNGDVALFGRDHVGKPSLRSAATTMLRAGRNVGITKEAKVFLRKAKQVTQSGELAKPVA